MKRMIAFVTAGIITSLLALGMLVIGVSAILNPNSVPPTDVPTNAAVAPNTLTADPQAVTQIDQLKAIVAQYQSREKQYQGQVDQLNREVQQLQSVVKELQRRGIIRVQNDGTVQLLRSRRDDD